MDRLIIQSIEGRVLAGIAMFVAIMILIGWVAINEEARMAAFREQHLGRSIERGAELYAANCSTCHGTDGLGQGGRAPGLNNPHFFSYDPLAELNGIITNSERIIGNLEAENELLIAEYTDVENPPTEERFVEIETRLDEITAELAEQEELRDQALADREATLVSLQPAVERGLFPLWQDIPEDNLTQYLLESGNRLSQVGWTGSLEGYTITTLIHGRPGSGNVWPNSEGMAAWSQTAGGPLRQDQIEDLTAYILNWDQGSEWTLEDFFAVEQYGKPLADGTEVETNGEPSVAEDPGNDPLAILDYWENNEILGDATNGESLYNGVSYGCSGCHMNGAAAPATEGTWTRTIEERLVEPELAEYTAEQYLIESIVLPGAYDYPNDSYAAGAMPNNFGERMSHQELADIIEYLKTQE